jgi:hypothetical protein
MKIPGDSRGYGPVQKKEKFFSPLVTGDQKPEG